MKWTRRTIAVGLLAGLGLACSKDSGTSRPASAPPPAEEQPLGPPKASGEGGGGQKQRPMRKPKNPG